MLAGPGSSVLFFSLGTDRLLRFPDSRISGDEPLEKRLTSLLARWRIQNEARTPIKLWYRVRAKFCPSLPDLRESVPEPIVSAHCPDYAG